MLSAAVRRTSRDVSIMKEKLIFSGMQPCGQALGSLVFHSPLASLGSSWNKGPVQGIHKPLYSAWLREVRRGQQNEWKAGSPPLSLAGSAYPDPPSLLWCQRPFTEHLLRPGSQKSITVLTPCPFQVERSSQ